MTATAELRAALAGRYVIERELGVGGMATVYLAEDVRHRRKVAIKVLRPELSAVLGPERFLKEIEVTAGLQHPHILPLFDSGNADGQLFYVMPYVEGETLRMRLDRERQLPVGDALRIASEVADALAYAHARAVIHRDIKPENILLQQGHALVADFGIALAVEHAGGQRMTQTGLSLGTPQYMAPEQAMGERNVDQRVDIYALGAVTYEMLSGEPPFTGPTAQAIVARVMTETPKPLVPERHSVPPHVEEAILKALEKLPADRFATAAEFSTALGATAPRRVAKVAPRRSKPTLLVVVGAALAVLALTAAGAYLLGQRRAATVAPLPSRLALLSPIVGGSGVAAIHRQIALTPRGDAVVFVAMDEQNENALAYQALDATTPKFIEHRTGLLNPLVSPDGRVVLGWSGGRLTGDQAETARVPIDGGTRRLLPAGVYIRHAAWGPDGTLWFTPLGRGGVSHLTPDGRVEPVSGGALDGFKLQHVLSDGHTAIGVRAPTGRSSGPAVLLDLRTGRDRPFLDLDLVEVRVAAGYLLYVRSDATMWAAPFDEAHAKTTGEAVQIADGISLTGTDVAQWAVASNGTVAYIPEEPRSLVFVARDGSTRPAIDERHNFHNPRFSPDGRRITVDFTSGDGRDVWILSLPQRTFTRATFTRDGHDAVWSTDGRTFDFTSFRGTTLRILQARPGSEATDSINASFKITYTGIPTPDGQSLLTVGSDIEPGSGSDLISIDHGGRGAIHPFVVDRFETNFPALSPDGRWVAYVSNKSGAPQVYVRPLAGGDELQVSRDGGTEPLWARNGKELFYVGYSRIGNQLVSATVRLGARLEVLGQQPLFGTSEIVGSSPHTNYDVSPDGSTFVMVKRSPATRIMIIQNLGALMERLRAPGGRS